MMLEKTGVFLVAFAPVLAAMIVLVLLIVGVRLRMVARRGEVEVEVDTRDGPR